MADKKQGSGANPPRDRLIGQQLGDYKLIGVLATGGMARVYEGVDVKLDRHAAVKVLEHDSIAEDQTLTQRFQREARAIAALEHDNIITIYQFGEVETEGVYFLAMKLIKGNTLANDIAELRLKKERMEIKRALHLLDQVGGALDFAHKAGIIHRDVKPSNVLLDQGDKAILTDFGLILQVEGVDKTLGTAFGTPRYIAPEQALASESAVPQSDLYSLGIITYELLTGEVPFKGESPMEIALSHISDTPPPLRSLNPAVPDEAEHEVLRMLEKEPDDRHQSAKEFVDALKRAYKMTIPVGGTQVTTSGGSVIVMPKPDTLLPKPGVAIGDLTTQPQTPIPIARKRRSLMPVFLIILILVAVTAGVYLVVTADDTTGTSNSGTQNAVVVAPSATDAATEEPSAEISDETLDPTRDSAATEQAQQQATLDAEETSLARAAEETVAAANMTETMAAVQLLATGNAESIAATANTLGTIQARVTATAEAVELIANATATANAGLPTATVGALVVGDGAPILLIYNEDAFAFINEGEYTLDVQTLEFVRGDDEGGDDFAGDRIRGNQLPGGMCYRIVRQGRQVDAPEGCRPLENGGLLSLQDVRNFFWRSEPDDYEAFDVRFEGITIATCETVARTEASECRFQWPVGPAT